MADVADGRGGATAGSEPKGAVRVEYRPIGDLVPYAGNSRTHSPSQVKALAAPITTFGWTNPILLDEQLTILAGHGRLAAAKLLGMTEVPCIVLRGLTDEQRRAYVIADNQIALNSAWDFGLLREEMRTIEGAGIDLSLLGNIELPVEKPKEQTWKPPVIKFNVVFDNEAQQQVWFEFLKYLKQEFPDKPTTAAALVEFLQQVSMKGDR